ncbi:polyamine aminopropyltransferase [Gallaecimonas sp. GXIMD4217]|uniref:polyamine aminopropyltransferase n=1 Tax=Gallaecimonas sp. GXIMD4217 TaxID=3131927 RepID=UPI00311AD326
MGETQRRLFDDSLLIGIMAVLAACGLIYEYLLSHYAGRVLGTLESAIYAMIGLMIVSMGLGAFAARKVSHPYRGFVWLELAIALVGASAVLVVAALIGFTQLLPTLVADTFALPPDIRPQGGLFAVLQKAASYGPYLAGTLLGFLVGMEIPLIARVREDVHQRHLQHNAGTIYGADYIGAGVGAALWVLVMLRLPISEAAAWTASLNLVAGLAFLWRFWSQMRRPALLLGLHLGLAGLVAAIGFRGPELNQQLSALLYQDKVVHQAQTPYQHLTFTERLSGNGNAEYRFYLNGRLQFSSLDEHIYHRMLVHPALLAARAPKSVLIIGGGDGLGLREVLRWDIEEVTLIDLDEQLLALFQQPEQELPGRLGRAMARLNQGSLRDPRLTLMPGDAFIRIDELAQAGRRFDAVIIDLPDPSHPDLNKLYSQQFYARLRNLLSGDGALVAQSTSPWFAQKAFISVAKTLAAAGFADVAQYHVNVPSFGEWGFSLAVPAGPGVKERLARPLPFEDDWLNRDILLAAFAWPSYFYRDQAEVQVNWLGSHVLYQYHQQAWASEQGLSNPLSGSE